MIDEQPAEPAKSTDPHVYHVVLEPKAAAVFEASSAMRERCMDLWSDKARGLGKKRVEVRGRHCLLAWQVVA
jgi:hypothetical protein